MDNDLTKYFMDEAKEIKHTQIEILQRIAKLEVKASLWGGLSGLLVSVGVVLLSIFKG